MVLIVSRYTTYDKTPRRYFLGVPNRLMSQIKDAESVSYLTRHSTYSGTGRARWL